MRKIDTQQFTRLMHAMEKMAVEMNKLHQTDFAENISKNRSELKKAYLKNCQLMQKLKENSELYFDTYEKAYKHYRLSSQHYTKIKRQKKVSHS